jgi:hypothetical protein
MGNTTMLKLIAAALSAGVLLFGASASADPVTLTYTTPASVQQGEPVLSLGTVADGRENDPDWFGAIRGGYGNPLKVLRTEGPVVGVVEGVLRQALAARGLVAEAVPARFRLDARLARFDSSQYARREAHIVLELTLVDLATNAQAYQRATTVDLVEGSVFSLRTGIFASPETLRALANRALQQGVDQALDDPGLRAALQAPAPAAATSPAPAAAPAN